MYYDLATLEVAAGRGGDGMHSFRRESMVPRGGPDGGNGGRGGDVILVVNPHLNTLLHFQHKSDFAADDGKRGGLMDMTGRSAKPLYIQVPRGTLIRDGVSKQVIGDLTEEGQQLVVAVGGRGGRGNAMYASATNQSPQIAENGAPGSKATLELELKLIADIGIVGKPNAGKSTLLSVVTAAKPKIANYPFTTLSPNLGVVQMGYDRTLVLADIPGLIEGASQGIGLGHEFLRHIERCRVLIHLVDGMAEDPLADFLGVNAELSAFGHGLIGKPQVVALTKQDLPDARAAYELFGPALAEAVAATSPDSTLLSISSATNSHVRDLLARAVTVLDALPPLEVSEIAPVLTMTDAENDAISVTRIPGGFRVVSRLLEKKAAMTRWDLDDSVLAFQRSLERSGVGPALEAQHVQPGDIVQIGEHELEWGI